MEHLVVAVQYHVTIATLNMDSFRHVLKINGIGFGKMGRYVVLTNFEKYMNELTDCSFAVVNGRPRSCDDISCNSCSFLNSKNCTTARLEWLKADYVEPPLDWTTVAVDTPIFVSVNGRDWNKRHFARYEKGKVWAWSMGATSWTTDDDDIVDWNYAKLKEE